jgi:hypothetical protein
MPVRIDAGFVILSSTLANFVAGWIRLFCKHFRCRLEFSYGLGCARDRNKSSVLHILGHSAYPPFRKLAKVELRACETNTAVILRSRP